MGSVVKLTGVLVLGLVTGISNGQIQTEASNPLPAVASIAPDARLIVNQYIDATGGRQGWDQLKSLQGNGTISMPLAGIAGDLSVIVTDDLYRRTMTLSGGPIKDASIQTGRNGDIVWQLTGDNGNFTGLLIEGAERARNLRQFQFNQLLDLDKNFSEVAMVDAQMIDGKNTLKLMMIPRSNPDSREYRYFDQESHEIIRTEVEEPGRPLQRTNFSNYRRFGPVKLHTQTDIMTSGQVLMRIAMPKMEVNQSVPESVHEMPIEIRVLIGDEKVAAPASPAGAPSEAPASESGS